MKKNKRIEKLLIKRRTLLFCKYLYKTNIMNKQQELDMKAEEIIYKLCNFVDEIVDAEQEEDYIKCRALKTLIEMLIDEGSHQLETIGCDIPFDEIKKHLTNQYLKILEGVRNFDTIYIDED
jgi:hypothetical protein